MRRVMVVAVAAALFVAACGGGDERATNRDDPTEGSTEQQIQSETPPAPAVENDARPAESSPTTTLPDFFGSVGPAPDGWDEWTDQGRYDNWVAAGYSEVSRLGLEQARAIGLDLCADIRAIRIPVMAGDLPPAEGYDRMYDAMREAGTKVFERGQEPGTETFSLVGDWDSTENFAYSHLGAFAYFATNFCEWPEAWFNQTMADWHWETTRHTRPTYTTPTCCRVPSVNR